MPRRFNLICANSCSMAEMFLARRGAPSVSLFRVDEDAGIGLRSASDVGSEKKRESASAVISVKGSEPPRGELPHGSLGSRSVCNSVSVSVIDASSRLGTGGATCDESRWSGTSGGKDSLRLSEAPEEFIRAVLVESVVVLG